METPPGNQRETHLAATLQATHDDTAVIDATPLKNADPTSAGGGLLRAAGLSAIASAVLAACGGGSDSGGGSISVGTSGASGAPGGSQPGGSGTLPAPQPPGGGTGNPGGGTGNPGGGTGNPGGGTTDPLPGDPANPPAPDNPGPGNPPAPPQSISDEQAARFLQQAQFSSADEDIAGVRALGYERWLDEQMALPIGQTGWDWLIANGYADNSGTATYGDYMIWQQLIATPDTLRKRVALALSEIIVISLIGLPVDRPSWAIAAYWDVLNQNALGNYGELLYHITLNPAMGAYLTTLNNVKADPATGRLPDENYAREVMQLFTIGLIELNSDGSAKRAADPRSARAVNVNWKRMRELQLRAGDPLTLTYDQDDVMNLARVFTGFVYDPTGTSTGGPWIPKRMQNPMDIDAGRHSTEDVHFLGATIPGSTPPLEKINQALGVIFNHPNVGPFVGRQLIQRLVTSAPSPQYIARVAAAFNGTGGSARGDMKATIKAVLLDPEARQVATGPAAGKLREPMLRFVQWARTFGAAPPDGDWRIGDKSNSWTALGQSPLRSPSVFNFFTPDYVPGDGITQPAPEFQITDEASVAGYVNFMKDAIQTGTDYHNSRFPPPGTPDGTNVPVRFKVEEYTREMALANDPAALIARLNLILTAGQLSAPTVAAMTEAIADIKVKDEMDTAGQKNRVWAAVLLVMASPEYLVQK